MAGPLMPTKEELNKHIKSLRASRKEKENVIHILENMIDGKPDDHLGIPLSEVLRYVEKT